MEQYQVTGNAYISLPTIRERDGAIEGISCLYMTIKGMIEMTGKDGFLTPFLQCDGEPVRIRPAWRREHCWIPSFRSEEGNISFSCTYLTPVGERGFALRLEAVNRTPGAHEIRVGVRGAWDETLHTVNESIPLTAGKTVKRSGWNDMFVFQQIPGTPLIAFAPVVGDHQPYSQIDQGAAWEQQAFTYSIHRAARLQPGETLGLDIFFGVGYEEVAAAASAKEMLRQGFEILRKRTASWLSAREKHMEDAGLEVLLNTNLFFAFFYASGRTVDTEELCMMTSRSPRYYVSAAYWDRDSLLWAFPAILEADRAYARELLLAVFHRQRRNFGVHSRYIDGTVLEPGFELDELCAPVLALERYVEKTGDAAILRAPEVRSTLEDIPRKLADRKHPSVALYSTFLQPTDDMHHYPYLTYDNVLVWKSLRALARWLDRPELMEQAERTRAAIWENAVFPWDGKKVLAWSVDLEGHWDIYDEPPGSLQLLPFHGFCGMDNPVWQATVSQIRDESYPLSFAGHAIAEIGCKHAPHPWILSICNSMLSGHRAEALDHLRAVRMDNGIACESVHEDTGCCETGAAFATCAGFLAFALLQGSQM